MGLRKRPAGGRFLAGSEVVVTVATQSRKAVASPVLAGRTSELTLLVDALADPPAVAFVDGEAGIGKTRLLRECLCAKPLAGRTVLVANCPPLAEPFPLGPIVNGVRRFRPALADVRLSPLVGALRPLFPEWADVLPARPEPPEDPAETRQQLQAALTELIDRLGVELLVLEDAHWADTATLEWLLTLISSGDLAVSIVMTYRGAEVPEGSLLRRLSSRPLDEVTRVRVELAPLGVAATRQLVGSMLGTDQVSDQFAAFLHEHTDGIPLALEETIRLLRERHDIIRQHGTWTRKALDDLDVPATVRDSVLERVERLSPEAREVLRAAAILAEPADPSLLTRVAGIDDEAGERGVAGALAVGLLHDVAGGKLVFRHVLDAQAVVDDLPASQRWALHARAAAQLRRLDQEPVVRLARHFAEAGDVDNWCHYAEAAADLAYESGDDRSAVMLLQRLLTAVEHPIARRARLAIRLGQVAFFGAATLGESLLGQVVAGLRGVLDSSVCPPQARGELRLLLGRLLWRVGERSGAFAELEAAVPDLAHRPDLALRAMVNLAAPMVSEMPAAWHRQWLERAAALVPEHWSPAERLVFAHRRASTLLALGEQAGWDAIEELSGGAAGGGEDREIASSWLNAAWSSLLWGRYRDTRRLLTIAEEQIRRTRFERVARHALLAEAFLNWFTGRWAGLRDTALALAEVEDAEPSDRLFARYVMGLLDLAAGARASAARVLRGVADVQGRLAADVVVVMTPAALGRLHLAEGAATEAVRETERVVELIARKGVWMWATEIAPVRLQALIATGQLTDAEQLVAEFAAGTAGRKAPAPAAAVIVCQALLAEAHGELAEAARLFAGAAQAWAPLPRPYDELLALERQGCCQLAGGDRDEGIEVLTGTERRLRELGAKWDADRVAQLLRQHGVEVSRAWKRGRKGYGDQLSPREVEVVALIATGLTNKQVAERLYLSPWTVGKHLAAAMRKLGVRSRTAVGAAATDAGLLGPVAINDGSSED